MGGSSQSSEMESISFVLLSRGETRRFAWGDDSKLKIKVYRNFREKKVSAPESVGAFGTEGVHGGPLLGARGGGFVIF